MGVTVPAQVQTDPIRATTDDDQVVVARVAEELQTKGYVLSSVDKLANWARCGRCHSGSPVVRLK